jgi:hypothetical protein
MFVCCECCVLSGRGLCDELISRFSINFTLLTFGYVGIVININQSINQSINQCAARYEHKNKKHIEYFVLKANLLFRNLRFLQWCCCTLTSYGMLGEWLQTFRAVFVPPSSGTCSQDNSRSAIHYHIASSLMLCSLWSNAVVKQVSVVVQSVM